MSKTANSLLIIFAKAPVAGEVNTRLIPDIGIEAATALQHEFIMHRMQQFAGELDFDIALHCAPDTQHECFQHCAEEYGVSLVSQRGEDLGHRMANAFSDACVDHDRVVLIGTDAPVLDVSNVTEAISHLDDNDLVLQPAEDGGYVLIGMRRFVAEVFDDIPWGSEGVMEATRMRLRDVGYRWFELPTTWDIDTLADLERYRRNCL